MAPGMLAVHTCTPRNSPDASRQCHGAWTKFGHWLASQAEPLRRTPRALRHGSAASLPSSGASATTSLGASFDPSAGASPWASFAASDPASNAHGSPATYVHVRPSASHAFFAAHWPPSGS